MCNSPIGVGDSAREFREIEPRNERKNKNIKSVLDTADHNARNGNLAFESSEHRMFTERGWYLGCRVSSRRFSIQHATHTLRSNQRQTHEWFPTQKLIFYM